MSAFWVLFALLGVDAAAGLVALALRFHTGNQVERQQLCWVAAASCVLLVGALIGGRTAPLTVALVLFVAAIGVAVLRYRLWDLDWFYGGPCCTPCSPRSCWRAMSRW